MFIIKTASAVLGKNVNESLVSKGSPYSLVSMLNIFAALRIQIGRTDLSKAGKNTIYLIKQPVRNVTKLKTRGLMFFCFNESEMSFITKKDMNRANIP